MSSMSLALKINETKINVTHLFIWDVLAFNFIWTPFRSGITIYRSVCAVI